jgi:hypothetical protein
MEKTAVSAATFTYSALLDLRKQEIIPKSFAM